MRPEEKTKSRTKMWNILEDVTTPRWDDLRFPVANLKTGSAGVPSWNNTYGVYEFLINEYLFCQVQLPHAWEVGSILKPHIHWAKTTSDTGLVKWQMDYRWAKIGEVIDSSWTTIAAEIPAVSDNDTAWTQALTAFPEIATPSDIQISDMLLCKISRETPAGASYGSNPAALLEFDIHYKIDSFGSTLEYIK